jgi:hypothetical protein
MYIKVYKSYYKGMVMNGYQKTTEGGGGGVGGNNKPLGFPCKELV